MVGGEGHVEDGVEPGVEGREARRARACEAQHLQRLDVGRPFPHGKHLGIAVEPRRRIFLGVAVAAEYLDRPAGRGDCPLCREILGERGDEPHPGLLIRFAQRRIERARRGEGQRHARFQAHLHLDELILHHRVGDEALTEGTARLGVCERFGEGTPLYAGRSHRVVDAAVAERRHHRPESVWRRCHLHRVGVLQLDLPGREPAGAELVLQPPDPVAVGRPVGPARRHQIEAQPAAAARRTLRPGEGERKPAIDVAGEPLESVEHDAAIRAACRGRGGADIAAALLLGDPGAAGRCSAVHSHERGQVGVPHRLRCEPVEHVGDGAGERHRTVNRDVGLCEQIAHREGQHVGAPLWAVVEPHDAPLVDLAVNRRIERIVADHRAGAAAFIQGFENRRREAVGVVRLFVDGGRHPAAETAQPFGVLFGKPGRTAAQEGLKIPVRPVDVAANTAHPVRHRCATF